MTTALVKTQITDRLVGHLAREIAMSIYPVEDILKANNVSLDQWDQIRLSDTFQTLYQREMEVWNSSLGTAERIRIKALTMVEDSLLTAARVIHNDNESAAGRAKMLETVAKIANLGDKPNMAGEGGRVTIQINMGADKQLSKEVTPEVTLIDATAEVVSED